MTSFDPNLDIHGIPLSDATYKELSPTQDKRLDNLRKQFRSDTQLVEKAKEGMSAIDRGVSWIKRKTGIKAGDKEEQIALAKDFSKFNKYVEEALKDLKNGVLPGRDSELSNNLNAIQQWVKNERNALPQNDVAQLQQNLNELHQWSSGLYVQFLSNFAEINSTNGNSLSSISHDLELLAKMRGMPVFPNAEMRQKTTELYKAAAQNIENKLEQHRAPESFILLASDKEISQNREWVESAMLGALHDLLTGDKTISQSLVKFETFYQQHSKAMNELRGKNSEFKKMANTYDTIIDNNSHATSLRQAIQLTVGLPKFGEDIATINAEKSKVEEGLKKAIADKKPKKASEFTAKFKELEEGKVRKEVGHKEAEKELQDLTARNEGKWNLSLNQMNPIQSAPPGPAPAVPPDRPWQRDTTTVEAAAQQIFESPATIPEAPPLPDSLRAQAPPKPPRKASVGKTEIRTAEELKPKTEDSAISKVGRNALLNQIQQGKALKPIAERLENRNIDVHQAPNGGLTDALTKAINNAGAVNERIDTDINEDDDDWK